MCLKGIFNNKRKVKLELLLLRISRKKRSLWLFQRTKIQTLFRRRLKILKDLNPINENDLQIKIELIRNEKQWEWTLREGETFLQSNWCNFIYLSMKKMTHQRKNFNHPNSFQTIKTEFWWVMVSKQLLIFLQTQFIHQVTRLHLQSLQKVKPRNLNKIFLICCNYERLHNKRS